MYKKMTAALCAGMLMTLGATAPLSANAASANSFKAAYGEAQKARKQAAAVGFEWRDTGKMLKKAKKLAAAGNFAKAEKLARKAQQQGKLATAQAAEQAQAWQAAVLR